MDYENFILLGDIPLKFDYKNKKNKKKCVVKILDKNHINIYTCNRGYRWIMRCDLSKIKRYLKDEPEKETSYKAFKMVFDNDELINGRTLKDIALSLGLSSSNAIRQRVNYQGWNFLDAITIPKGGRVGPRDKVAYKIKRKSTIKRRR